MDPQASSSRSIEQSDLEHMLLDEAAEPMALPFSLLEKITENFYYKNEIGRGGFAVVYMGRLENGAVAVKRLSDAYKYEKEFLREIESLMKVKHKNIVRFLGYCVDIQGRVDRYNEKFVMADIQERLLCFVYLPNGSLNKHIKDASFGIEWKTCYRIIKGVCEGLPYLHSINIMHLDLKPSNILMDDNMIPKITDFGVSRSFEEMQTRTIATKMIGTIGYMAPEFQTNVITRKFDLYSLGVIIMEILTGKREYQPVENVLESCNNRLELSQGNQHYEQIRVCAQIGIECMEFDPTNRPASMSSIMDRLAETERIEIMPFTKHTSIICCLDAHPTEPWIIIGDYEGRLLIWNFDTQATEALSVLGTVPQRIWQSFKNLFKEEEEATPTSASSAKIVARKQWVLAGDDDGYIHVYHYGAKPKKIRSFKGSSSMAINSLAIHPTKPYVLSATWSYIDLWDWENNWKHVRIFKGHSGTVCQVAFNPRDHDSFASASEDKTVMVWNLNSPQSRYTLLGHSCEVTCLDFFTRHGQEYLVTGSKDWTAKIWDMQQKRCIDTIKGFTCPITSAISIPDRPYVITASDDGLVHLWSPYDYRLKRIFDISMWESRYGREVKLAYLTATNRIVIGHHDAVAVLDK